MSNYTIPKGKIYFNKGNGERYLGNTPGADITVAATSLDHFSAESGIKQKDDTALVEIVRTLSITADDVSSENLSLFIVGATPAIQTQASGSVVAEALPNAINGAIKQDRWFQIGATTANPSGVRKVSAVVVKVAASVKVLNTDYTLDTDLGRIYIIPGGGIADADAVTVDYTKAATTREQILSASLAATAGSLRFIADNPKGINRDIFMPSVNLKPNGKLSLKGDTAAWVTMGFDVDILVKDSVTAAMYIDGRAV